jgi:hypothetical protein
MSAYHSILPLTLVAATFMNGSFSEAHLGSQKDTVFLKNGLAEKETAILECPNMVQCNGEDGAAKLLGANDPIHSLRFLSADGIVHCSCGTCTKAAFSLPCAIGRCDGCCTDGTCASCTSSYCGSCMIKGCCSPDEKGYGISCAKSSFQSCPYGSCTSCYKKT